MLFYIKLCYEQNSGIHVTMHVYGCLYHKQLHNLYWKLCFHVCLFSNLTIHVKNLLCTYIELHSYKFLRKISYNLIIMIILSLLTVCSPTKSGELTGLCTTNYLAIAIGHTQKVF